MSASSSGVLVLTRNRQFIVLFHFLFYPVRLDPISVMLDALLTSFLSGDGSLALADSATDLAMIQSPLSVCQSWPEGWMSIPA